MPTMQAARTTADRRVIPSMCSWCGEPIGTAASSAGSEKNFGICPSCLETELARLGRRKRARHARKDGASAASPASAAPVPLSAAP